MIVIIIRKRTDDWLAYLKGKAQTWESGRTKEEAIGKLMLYHGLVVVEEEV